MINKELIKGSTVTLILNTLKKEPMYGYGMIKAIEERSNGIFSFKEGTLYPILHDLEEKDLVESYWEQQEQRRRKYYRITEKGLKELDKKQTEWHIFSKAMNLALGH